MRLPSIVSVRSALKDVRDDIQGEVEAVDVRLQVYPDGAWAIRVGPSDYDLDHHGWFGAGSVSPDDKIRDLDASARDLIDQIRDAKASC